MFSKTKLTKMFAQPTKYANQIIEDQLERMEVRFDQFLDAKDAGNALAIYQEYSEWIETEEGQPYGFMQLSSLS